MWAIMLAVVIWLLFVASLDAFYRAKISIFEHRLSLLKEGMPARDVVKIIGPPHSVSRATRFLPSSEAVPDNQIILSYCYSKRSFKSYEICGIYIDVDKQQLIKLSPYRTINFWDGIWPWNLLVISFVFILLGTVITITKVCRKAKAGSSNE